MFIYDTVGRLKIDPNLSIGTLELKMFTANRAFISASIISALNAYEMYLYKEVLPKLNYQVRQLLPFQIKDTTSHLYKINCDSSKIVSIEHTLLSGDAENGSKADSLIKMTLHSLFPYLNIQDGNLHTYYIPVIYIPFRFKQPDCTFYFCNCQFNNGLVSPILIDETCVGSKGESETFKNGFLAANTSCSLDAFYVVIADGKPLSPCLEESLEKIPTFVEPNPEKRQKRKNR
jgi:hypothetical protein